MSIYFVIPVFSCHKHWHRISYSGNLLDLFISYAAYVYFVAIRLLHVLFKLYKNFKWVTHKLEKQKLFLYCIHAKTNSWKVILLALYFQCYGFRKSVARKRWYVQPLKYILFLLDFAHLIDDVCYDKKRELNLLLIHVS